MSTKKNTGFTEEEKAAMKEHLAEQKAAAKRTSQAEDEAAVLAKIAEMEEPDRSMALRIHEIVKTAAPMLSPKLWYGMPAYARDGKVVCFFQNAQKFKARYSTFGFNDSATLDDGNLWATGFALTKLTDHEAQQIADLVRRAVQ